MIEVLNGYAGLGGNRKLWRNVKVTAVEKNPEIAAIYQDLFPEDTVIVGDAHEYLLEHYMRFPFIWLSRPCTTHSKIRFFVGVRAKGFAPVYPDYGLYEEITFLKYNAVGLYTAENVVPYYEPLIKPTAKIGRHLLWANFEIKPMDTTAEGLRTKNTISEVEALRGLDLSKYKIKNKRQLLRNCVDDLIGNHIFNCAFPSTKSIHSPVVKSAAIKQESMQNTLF